MLLTSLPKDLKLKYYDLMIQYALHEREYLNVAKYYHKVWETPSIKEDENDKGREVCVEWASYRCDLFTDCDEKALEHVIYYVILAPHDNEQSDMLHRVYQYPLLLRMDLQR